MDQGADLREPEKRGKKIQRSKMGRYDQTGKSKATSFGHIEGSQTGWRLFSECDCALHGTPSSHRNLSMGFPRLPLFSNLLGRDQSNNAAPSAADPASSAPTADAMAVAPVPAKQLRAKLDELSKALDADADLDRCATMLTEIKVRSSPSSHQMRYGFFLCCSPDKC